MEDLRCEESGVGEGARIDHEQRLATGQDRLHDQSLYHFDAGLILNLLKRSLSNFN